MNKILVIGDLHFDNKYPGYLLSQSNTLCDIVKSVHPTCLILLGDIFHYRKPSPECLLEFQSALREISLIPGLSKIYLLRGNHDSANKSDDGRTVLELYNSSRVHAVVEPFFDNELNVYLIPHYENNVKIIKHLHEAKEHAKFRPYMRTADPITFGHFGYTGCLNSIGVYDFSIDIKEFPNKTFLGHIHKFKEEGNITVLGTPWSTYFGECDYKHYYAVLTGDGYSDYKIDIKEIDFGVRHYSIPYEALEANKEEISNPKFKTILRVLISKFDPEGLLSNPVNLRKRILSEYNVSYVDLKFQPILTDKWDRQSAYIPGENLSDINDRVISQYLEENKTSIPNEDLMNTLNEIKEFKNL